MYLLAELQCGISLRAARDSGRTESTRNHAERFRMPPPPGPLHVANQAQQMARQASDERLSLAFQWIAVTSMAVMGVTAAAHLVRDLLRPQRTRGRE